MVKIKGRVFHGDTKPDLIEKAMVALKPQCPCCVDEDDNELYYDQSTPTSVEILDHTARVWFEYDPDYDEEYDYKWEFYYCVPLYHFWGRKKRENYLKEQRQLSKDRLEKLEALLAELKKRK